MREFKRNAALRYVMQNIVIISACGDVITLAHIDHEY